jgi:hypothetical protein
MTNSSSGQRAVTAHVRGRDGIYAYVGRYYSLFKSKLNNTMMI